MWSARSAPAAANTSASSPGIVITVGPLSSRKPSRSITPARPPGRSPRSTIVTSWPAPDEVGCSAEPAQAGAHDDDPHRSVSPVAGDDERRQCGQLAAGLVGDRQPVEGGDRGRGQLVDVGLDLGEGAGVEDHLLDLRHLVVAESRCTDPGEHVELGRLGHRHRSRQQRRRLALTQVVADWLAGDRRVAEGADHVVAQLEGVAERNAVGAEARQQLPPAGRVGEHRADVQRALDGVLGRLVAGDPLAPSPAAGRPAPTRGCRGTARR